MMPALTWIWSNIWTLTGLFLVLRYRKIIYQDLIFTPLAGGNGKVQMDELAKFVILAVFVGMAYLEATRPPGTPQILSNEYYYALLLTVCAIAAIKPAFGNIKNFRDPSKKEQQNETH